MTEEQHQEPAYTREYHERLLDTMLADPESITLSRDYFEHLLSCLDNQKFLNVVNADGLAEGEASVRSTQAELQMVIDAANRRGRALLQVPPSENTNARDGDQAHPGSTLKRLEEASPTQGGSSDRPCPHGNDYDHCAACVAAVFMRRFVLDRRKDVTGISGTGVILYGIEWFPGGPVDVYWRGTKTTGQYPSMAVVESTHCYNGNAQVVYLDGNGTTSHTGATQPAHSLSNTERASLLTAEQQQQAMQFLCQIVTTCDEAEGNHLVLGGAEAFYDQVCDFVRTVDRPDAPIQR